MTAFSFILGVLPLLFATGAGAASRPEAANLYDLGVGASWEIDLWGRVRRQVGAADTERSLLVRQDDLAASEGLVIRNLVDLYRALGGGWDPETAEQPVTPPSSFDKEAQEESAE